jgi:hypothetical protein
VADLRRIGKYKTLEEIGCGGFAVVYRARNAALNPAPKVAHSPWTAFLRLTTYACCVTRITDRFRHPTLSPSTRQARSKTNCALLRNACRIVLSEFSAAQRVLPRKQETPLKRC